MFDATPAPVREAIWQRQVKDALIHTQVFAEDPVKTVHLR